MFKGRIKVIIRSYLGSEWGRKLVTQSMKEVTRPTKALEKLSNLDDSPVSQQPFDEPIFILSAGWRSGSTLLQRMLTKDDELIMWGEPYHRSNIIDNMLAQLTPLQGEWPPKDYYIQNNAKDLSNQWIANCWPQTNHLKNAHRAYWYTLFGLPANHLSKSKWGIKEVRWGKKHVEYLKWLFPKAKFIYLIRNPLDAYASFYHYPKTAFLNWPNEPIQTAKDYAKMWLKLASEFEDLGSERTGILLRYEDLRIPKFQRKLELYLGTKVHDPSNLSKLVTPGRESKDSQKKTIYRLPRIERLLLNIFLKNKLNKYDYEI